MAKTPAIHVVPRPGGRWAVERDGARRAGSVHDSQAEAAEVGRRRAQTMRTELNLHGQDGTIREKHSYGSDPYPPRG